MNTEDDAAKKTFPYGSREEAERVFDERVHKRQFTFCPLWRGRCKEACTCYEPPVVRQIGTNEKKTWVCQGGHCNCYMLHRPE